MIGLRYLLKRNNMKKIIILLTSIISIILMPILGDCIFAENDIYPIACSIYSVDYINDDGTFDNVGCYNDFASAKAKMYENDDYVVRHASGYSATRIVAMNSGLVYSFPRGSSSTMSIYSDYDNHNKTTTYVTARYEMSYVDTPYMSAKSGFEGQGYTEVILNGFHGYADTEYLDFVPSKYIDKQLPIYLGGSYSNNTISSAALKVIPNYYVINKNGNYYDLEFHYHISYPDKNGFADEYTIRVDNAANYSFLKVGTKYYSDDGINFYTDYTKKNKVGSSYNYYQFLPLRTKTNISGSTMDAFIKYIRSDYSSSVMYGKGDTYLSLGDAYGCNGALVFALSCQESAYGTSGYAKERNNLFGWNAYDDSPDDATYYSSVDVAIKEQMGRNLRRFADYADPRYNGTYVGSKGSGFNLKYAADPYWGMKIAAIYYNLDKFANNSNGNLTDYNSYTLGLINTNGATIYADQNCSKSLCNSYYYGNRQQDNIVVLNEKIGNVYKIQFSNPIIDGSVINDIDGVYEYSWSKSVGYIKCNDIDVLFNKNVANADLPHESIINVNSVKLNGSSLTINGIGAISNVNFSNANDVKHTLTLIDMNDENNTYSYDAGRIDTNGFDMNDGFNYKYAGFEATINLADLDLSSYIMNITTSVGDISKTTTLKTTDTDFRSIASNDTNNKYRFSANQAYSYRIEIDVLNSPIDYINIEKPSKRSSLIEYFNPTFNDDNTISISGYAMIYYLDYSEEINDRYTLYLIDNNTGVYKTVQLENNIIDDDIKNQINSVYDINYIGFSGTIELNELAEGEYTLLLAIKTSDGSTYYTDYLEFVAEGRTMPSKKEESKSYKFYISNIRNRLMLSIDEVL